MPKSRIPSPSRSQGGITPRRLKSRSTRSVGSPARSTASGRLTSVIDHVRDRNMDSFALSPLTSRRSVLTDNTDIEEPRRKSWWKNLNDNSRDVLEVLSQDIKVADNKRIEELMDVEVLSQEKKNYTLDLPESSDNESIHSIVLPERKLFIQKENKHQKKFGQLIGARETLAKLNKTNHDKTVNAGTRELFQGAKRSKPIFPAALLNISPDKTVADKTKENVAIEKPPVRNIFGKRPANKRKNIFSDFIASESEDEISEIQPKQVFGFQKQIEQRRVSSVSYRGDRIINSPTSSITTDIETDFLKYLPSSTMVEHQLEDLEAGTPVKRAKLSKLSEDKESDAGTTVNKTVDKTKQSNKSQNKSKSALNTNDISLNNSRVTRSQLKNISKINESANVSKKQNRSNKSQSVLNTKDLNTSSEKPGDDNIRNMSKVNKSLGKIKNNSQVIDQNDEENIHNQTKVSNKSVTKSMSTSKISKIHKENDVLEAQCESDNGEELQNEDNFTLTYEDDNEIVDAEVDKLNKNRISSKTTNRSDKDTTVIEKTLADSSKNKSLNYSKKTTKHFSEDNIDGKLNKEEQVSQSNINFISKAAATSEELEDVNDYQEDEIDNLEIVNESKHKSKLNISKTMQNMSNHSKKVNDTLKSQQNYVEEKESAFSDNQNMNVKENQRTEAVIGNEDIDNAVENKMDVNEQVNTSNAVKHKKASDSKETEQIEDEIENMVGQDDVNQKEDINKSQEEVLHKSDKGLEIENIESNEVESEDDDNQDSENEEADEIEMTENEEKDESQDVENEEADVSQEIENEDDNESQDVESEAADESKKIENEESSESEEIENVEEDESQEIENDQADKSQEIENDEVNKESENEKDYESEVQDIENEADASQEIENEEANEESESEKEDGIGVASESQDIENKADESQEVENEEADESQDIDDEEAHESQDIDDEEAHESQDIEDEEENQESENEVADESQEIENEDDEENKEEDESQEIENEEIDENDEVENVSEIEEQDIDESDKVDATYQNEAEMPDEDHQDDMEVDEDDENYQESDAINGSEQNQSEVIGDVIEESPNFTHDTTGRNRNKDILNRSPEAILHDKTKQMNSFITKGRNTSIRQSKSMLNNLNIKPSLAPPRDSIGFSDGTRDSSAEGSGWDSHRTTRKTLRQTFGKDYSIRKSLRALVMEKSAKRQTEYLDQHETAKFPQANSTEHEDLADREEAPNHEMSPRTRQTTLEMYLDKIKQQNAEKRLRIEEAVRSSLKPHYRDPLNLFKVPTKPPPKRLKPSLTKPKQTKPIVPLDELPTELIEDMKYKPPKRFRPSNASWITKRLYKFLENKLEPNYDYKARIRAEKLVETMYEFAKSIKRHHVAPTDATDVLKHELARLDVVKTHFEFYEFIREFMPREVRIKVIPDIVNKIPLPRHGVFTDILRGNTVQG